MTSVAAGIGSDGIKNSAEVGGYQHNTGANESADGVVATGEAFGRNVYNNYCYFCHGYSGDAKTLASTYLTPPPRDFTAMQLTDLSREAMIMSVTDGREGSAMMSFAAVLNHAEIEAVVDYVRDIFIVGDGLNTRYHILENGWDDHERYAPAFPFALGEIALDTPLEQLTDAQREGRQLFITSCVTCHDRSGVRSGVDNDGDLWQPRSVSYPRGGYSNKDETNPGESVIFSFERDETKKIDALSSATPFARHEIAPKIDGLTPQQKLGETIFQANCAFCHGATGTGRNWIGSFLQPPPRDLTDVAAMEGMNHQRLTNVITNGLSDTTMPAWGDVLTVDEIGAVAAYVMRVFVPPGDNKGGNVR